jgi:hypothetical protein
LAHFYIKIEEGEEEEEEEEERFNPWDFVFLI